MVIRALLFLTFLSALVIAQDTTQNQMNLNDYLALAKEDLAVQSKKLMLVNMQLSEEEGKNFWPIYDEYFAERSKIMDERVAMFKKIAEKYGTLSESDAKDIANTFFALENKLSTLEKNTYDKIAGQLSSLRGIQFLQIQRQIDTIVRLQISAQIPLLK